MKTEINNFSLERMTRLSKTLVDFRIELHSVINIIVNICMYVSFFAWLRELCNIQRKSVIPLKIRNV